MARTARNPLKTTEMQIRGSEQKARILAAIARYKGQPVSVVINDSGTALVDRSLTIEGFWPVVEYLEERFPYPPILPDMPVRRALVRSLVEGLRADPKAVLPRLAGHSSKFIVADRPMLLDFVVYGHTKDDAQWTKLTEALEAEVGKQPLDP